MWTIGANFALVVRRLPQKVDTESTGYLAVGLKPRVLTEGVALIAIVSPGPSDRNHLEETGEPGQPRHLDWAIRRDRKDVWPV